MYIGCRTGSGHGWGNYVNSRDRKKSAEAEYNV